MKKSVKILLSMFGAAAILSAGFALGQRTTADERRVYIADENLRAAIIDEARWNPETGEEEIIENELPTVDQVARIEMIDFSDVRSLEGVQYIKDARRFSYSVTRNDVIDFRPLSEMENLEELYIYSSEEYGHKPLDISSFGNLSNLRRLDLNYYAQVLDFSSLSSLENLETLNATGGGMIELSPLYVSRETREAIIGHPVTYSTQFDGERSVFADLVDTNGAYTFDVEVSLDGDKVTVSDLDVNTARIEFTFYASAETAGFGARTGCSLPIIWY
ncbi:hypothetical protein I6N96_09335 [Enterococcus sp. BWM-S5]|uniref:Leucine-rich repeat domain-containing protein n=1 Tax=Enterococcus larvae TaxID=2794352 RepID=A0ABS4CIR3_9ENTE|nr:hypothetical protein [Enterococcus larvae]MBP1046487.1 hypothetical protein [Enterococcus larvae]